MLCKINLAFAWVTYLNSYLFLKTETEKWGKLMVEL